MKLEQILCYLGFAVFSLSLVFVFSTAVNEKEGGANNGGINNPRISTMGNPHPRNGQAKTIHAKLIHRDLVVPPHFPDYDYDIGDAQAHAYPLDRTGLFFVNVSIGTPPQSQLLVMDTGSSVTVVRLSGCTIGCQNSQLPLYNPSDSSTYENSTCESEYCKGIFTSCDKFSFKCILRVSYLDGTQGQAWLSKDTFRFITSDSDDGFLDIPQVVFGCTNKLTWKERLTGMNGVLGLGPRIISLVEQRFYKFSYCIGNLNDRLNDNNILVLGEKAITDDQVNSTPLKMSAQYYITLQAVSVGYSTLDKMPEGVKAIMDTGSTITYIPKDIYNFVKKEIKKALKGVLVHIRDEPTLCYDGKLKRDFEHFPLVVMYFADGARLYLQPENLFEQHVTGYVCLGIMETNTTVLGNVVLVGMLAQQNYNIGYDLLEGRLYMRKIDCGYLIY